MSYKIPFIKPDFPDEAELLDDYRKILESNWYTNFGPYEQRFRTELSNFVGSQAHATTVANATVGLMIAIRALFKTDRKIALMPSFTFAAGAEALLWCGFQPAFIDVNKESWQPDLDQAANYLAENHDIVAGILLCNTFGVGNPEIDAWENLAKKYNLPLVIDSAAGFGSRYSGDELVGLRGDCEVFSFHATKPFAIGEGGGIISRNKNLIEQLDRLQNFGFDANKEVQEIGLNAKLQEIDAAIGLRQLPRLAERISRRRAVLAEYRKHLDKVGFSFQSNAENSSVCFTSVLAPSAEAATTFISATAAAGIQTRNYYNPPLHKHAVLRSSSVIVGQLEVTEDICSRIISLPVHDNMDTDLVAKICSFAKGFSGTP